jgi:hypothetical protein
VSAHAQFRGDFLTDEGFIATKIQPGTELHCGRVCSSAALAATCVNYFYTRLTAFLVLQIGLPDPRSPHKAWQLTSASSFASIPIYSSREGLVVKRASPCPLYRLRYGKVGSIFVFKFEWMIKPRNDIQFSRTRFLWLHKMFFSSLKLASAVSFIPVSHRLRALTHLGLIFRNDATSFASTA